MKTFTPIAMRCNKKQFKAIKPKLKGDNIIINSTIGGFEEFGYLVNNSLNISYRIENITESSKTNNNRQVYETWNEEIFLKACGIETDTFEVSKDFIIEAHNSACKEWKSKLEEKFPSVFVKYELEVGKWYKSTVTDNCFTVLKSKEKGRYGFDSCGWYDSEDMNDFIDAGCRVEATQQEVSTALIAEAKKRFNFNQRMEWNFNGVNYICTYPIHNNLIFINNKLTICGGILFQDGIWATIIEKPKYTKEQAEQKFNISIV